MPVPKINSPIPVQYCTYRHIDYTQVDYYTYSNTGYFNFIVPQCTLLSQTVAVYRIKQQFEKVLPWLCNYFCEMTKDLTRICVCRRKTVLKKMVKITDDQILFVQ